ncbi:MAG: hypothetical protein HQL46_05130 [Gammaproteobacteria bacterium]|nr:hypothetical protein [Gammaproteobacteria bacterium]
MFKSLIRLILVISLLLLNGCFTDEAIQSYQYTDHALATVISKDGDYILIAHSAGHVDLNRIDKNIKPKKISQWAHQEKGKTSVIAADFSRDNEYIVTIEQQTIARYSLKEKKVVNFWSLDNMSDVKISADGEFALVASKEKKTDPKIGTFFHHRLMYFHLPTGTIKYALYHDNAISSVALSEHGKYALSGSDDGIARLWDLDNGEIKFEWNHKFKVGGKYKKSKISHVQLSADGRYALTNNSNGDIRIYNTRSGKLHKKLKLPLATISSARFSNDNKFVAIGLTREQLQLWRVKDGELLKTWHPARRYMWQSSLAGVNSLAFSDKNHLVTITKRGIAQKWKF